MTEVKDKSDMHTENPFNIEERMGRMEGALGQMGERLNHVDTEIGGLRGEVGELRSHVDTGLSGMRGEMGGLRGEMDGLRGELDERFRSTNRIMITMWVTIIIAILSGILTMIFKM